MSINRARPPVDMAPIWAAPLGAIILLVLFASVALAAAGGWDWFAGFLVSSAASWVQAFGAIASIWGAFAISNKQRTVEIKASAEAARQLRRGRLEVCRTVLDRGVSVFLAAETLEEKHAPAVLRREVAEAMRLLQALPLFEVPDPLLVHRLGLLGQSLQHLLIGLDQIDRLADEGTRSSYVATSAEHVHETTVTLLYCRRLILKCSTKQERCAAETDDALMLELKAVASEVIAAQRPHADRKERQVASPA